MLKSVSYSNIFYAIGADLVKFMPNKEILVNANVKRDLVSESSERMVSEF